MMGAGNASGGAGIVHYQTSQVMCLNGPSENAPQLTTVI